MIRPDGKLQHIAIGYHDESRMSLHRDESIRVGDYKRVEVDNGGVGGMCEGGNYLPFIPTVDN